VKNAADPARRAEWHAVSGGEAQPSQQELSTSPTAVTGFLLLIVIFVLYSLLAKTKHIPVNTIVLMNFILEVPHQKKIVIKGKAFMKNHNLTIKGRRYFLSLKVLNFGFK
jgi:hypothetical protein